MRSWLYALGAAGLLATLGPGLASAQPAPAAASPALYVVKLVNGDTQAITSIYASPPGKNEWGDDLLGKQTAAVGKSVTLRFRNLPPEACMQDLQMLMNDGKTVEKAGIDVCKTPEYRFSR